MAFTLPNVAVAGFPDQAEPDSVDIDILTAGHSITGVVSGCAVTAQGVPDMTVAVASGTVSVLGVNAAVTSGNVTISAAHATLARKDIVVASSAGAKSVVTGTAAAQPLKPAVPAASVALAEVYVPASDAAISSNQITDKRVIVLAATQKVWKILAEKSADEGPLFSNTTLQNDDHLFFSVNANETWRLKIGLWHFDASAGVGDIKVAATWPSGTVELTTVYLEPTGTVVRQAIDSSGSGAGLFSRAGAGEFVEFTGIAAIGGTGGTFQVQWAQNVSNASGITVKKGSYIAGVLL